MSTKTGTQLWRNALTLTGAALSLVSVLFILSFLLVELASNGPSPYLGLFTFLILPCGLLVGILLTGAGVLMSRWRHRRQHGKTDPVQYYPRIDLNLAHHRRVLTVIGIVVVAAVPLIGLVSYEGYHYTDSNEFCGLVCHAAMEPQSTTHATSPHANVNCAECHVGPGASWYVRSKLSGVRQLLAVVDDSFPRPIPPAIRALRPATETCRQCHWAAKFFGNQLVTIHHFASDETNTRHRLRMLLKTGGSDRSTGPPSGIHWHMTLGFTVEYVATDDHLQEIPWVRTVDHTNGEERIYRSDGKLPSDPPPAGIRRVVDCMDCHNRPAHMFRSPDRGVDVAFHVDPRLRSLPFAKREVVSALVFPYASKKEGLAGVRAAIQRYYRVQWPGIREARREDIDRLADVAVEFYGANFFPGMNVNWRTYPDNIGHKIFPGCFRCHDGKHVDRDDEPISHACGTCHTFLNPIEGDGAAHVTREGAFHHPVELAGGHAALRCDQCHTGGTSPIASCEGCHVQQSRFRNGVLTAFEALKLPAEAMAEGVDCEGCHDLAEPTSVAAIDVMCLDCHEDQADRYDGMLRSWEAEVSRLLLQAGRRTDDEGRRLLDALRAAGPLHNIEATRMVTRRLIEGSSR